MATIHQGHQGKTRHQDNTGRQDNTRPEHAVQDTTGKRQRASSNRGFASMDPQRQREIAAEGGRAAHASGNAHEFTSEEAREAGSKGGRAAHQSGNAHEFSSEEARLAGAKGGRARSNQEQRPDTV